MSLYQQEILEHYRHPHNHGRLGNGIHVRDVNTSCGDAIEMDLVFENGVLKDVKFEGKGCAISIASASMLTDFVKGKSAEEIAKIDKEQVLEMIHIPVSGMRLKCALLGLKVLKLGVYQQLGGEHNGSN